MTRHFIRVLCDVHCEWEGQAPDYRVFVDDELFTERTFNFTDAYLDNVDEICRVISSVYLDWIEACRSFRAKNSRG